MTCTQYSDNTVMHVWYRTVLRKKALLLGVVALCTRMGTSTYALYQLPRFQTRSVPCLTLNITFLPTHHHM
jgi:hypothetical protein